MEDMPESKPDKERKTHVLVAENLTLNSEMTMGRPKKKAKSEEKTEENDQ